MASVGSLVFEMSANIARLQQDMAKATGTVDTAMKGIQSAANMAKSALEGIAAGLTIGAFTNMVNSTIKAEAHLHDLALQTGITVETLSALKGVAKLAGTDLDNVSGMVNKLEKNMLTFVQSGSGKAAAAFQQLGFSQKDVQKGLQDMDTFLPQFARKLIDSGVGGEQAALSLQLLGKSGAQNLPFIKELAEQLKLTAKVTTDQANAAHHFEQSMIKLQSSTNALKAAIANNLLPYLNSMADAMLRAKQNGEGFFMVMSRGIAGLLQGPEQNKLDKAYFEKTSQMLQLQGEIEAMRAKGAAPDSIGITSREAGVAKLQEQLRAIQARRELLAQEKKVEDEKNKPKHNPLGDAGGAKEEPSFWTPRDEEMYRHRVAAMKEMGATQDELDKIEQQRADRLYANDKAAQKELDDLAAKNAALEDLANKYRDFADPARVYRRELATINMLLEQGRIDADTYAAASAKIWEQINDLDKVAEKTKDTTHWARDMGLTFNSAFENAIVKGQKLSTVLQSLAQDIAQIAFRKQVTEPLGAAVAGMDWKGLFGFGGTAGQIGKGASALEIDQLGVGLPVFPQAAGGDYLVNKPTLFLAGEAGPERATFGSPDSGGGTVVNITLNAIDTRSGVQFLAQNKDAIGAIVNQAFLRGGRRSGMTL